MSQAESLENVTFVHYLLLSKDKLELGDLEAMVSALKRDLRAQQLPESYISSVDYPHFRQTALDQLDQCYAELDQRLLATNPSAASEPITKVSSPYLAEKFRKLSDSWANSESPSQTMLDLFGPGKLIESYREREAGLAVVHQCLQKMPVDVRNLLVMDLMNRLRGALMTNTRPTVYEMQSAFGPELDRQLHYDPEYQKVEFLLFAAAEHLDESQTIELLTELALGGQLNWLATSNVWGSALAV